MQRCNVHAQDLLFQVIWHDRLTVLSAPAQSLRCGLSEYRSIRTSAGLYLLSNLAIPMVPGLPFIGIQMCCHLSIQRCFQEAF